MTGVQTCALPIWRRCGAGWGARGGVRILVARLPLGYYRIVQNQPSRAAARLLALLSAGLCMACISCRGPAGSVAVMDPVFAWLSPAGAGAFGSVARDVVELPDSGASAALYAALDSAKPHTVFLSPLLASEIQAILSRDGNARVAYLGNATPASDRRLYAAVFSSIDAASLAGAILAAESVKIGPEARAAAVFTDPSVAEAASAAFRDAFMAAGGAQEPRIELSTQGFSQNVADRLKSQDIRAAYVSAPPRDAERWTKQAFDPSAFVIIEQGLPPSPTVSSADAFVAWDVESSVSSLGSRLETGQAGAMPGAWKYVPARRYGTDRRSGSGR